MEKNLDAKGRRRNRNVGFRVSEEEEIKGLDPTEHGLPTAYADFLTTK